jgi:hypothetical protein
MPLTEKDASKYTGVPTAGKISREEDFAASLLSIKQQREAQAVLSDERARDRFLQSHYQRKGMEHDRSDQLNREACLADLETALVDKQAAIHWADKTQMQMAGAQAMLKPSGDDVSIQKLKMQSQMQAMAQQQANMQNMQMMQQQQNAMMQQQQQAAAMNATNAQNMNVVNNPINMM